MIRRNQPELFDQPIPPSPEFLTVGQGLWILWEGHLAGKPSGASYLANKKALCQSFDAVRMDEIGTIDFARHRQDRLRGENGFKRVKLGTVYQDHGLFRLLYSKIRQWKRDKAKIAGVYIGNVALPDYFPTDGVKRTKPPKRKVVATPADFLALCQHATPRLKRTLEALLDLDVRRGDLKDLRPSNYNPYTDQVEWVQSKTGKENCVPVTSRVRQHFIEAREQGREFVYDITNVRKEFEETRHATKLWHLTTRDIRKTAYNAALRHTGSHHLAGMFAGHASTRTGIEHYEIEFRQDLRPVVDHIEQMFKSN